MTIKQLPCAKGIVYNFQIYYHNSTTQVLFARFKAGEGEKGQGLALEHAGK